MLTATENESYLQPAGPLQAPRTTVPFSILVDQLKALAAFRRQGRVGKPSATFKLLDPVIDKTFSSSTAWCC